jgi:hypothetical protein
MDKVEKAGGYPLAPSNHCMGNPSSPEWACPSFMGGNPTESSLCAFSDETPPDGCHAAAKMARGAKGPPLCWSDNRPSARLVTTPDGAPYLRRPRYL